MKALLKVSSVLLLVLLVAFSANSYADFDSKHKLVIQVSTDDPRTQRMALNNVVNLQKHYGIDNIDIEIVAYGPGLGLVTSESPEAARVTSLTLQQVTFTACGNTMETIHRKTGKMPELLDGVEQVTTGVARIIELQEQGYAYVRP